MSRRSSSPSPRDAVETLSVCPECGDEYRAGFTTCSDCGVALVLPELPLPALTADDALVEVAFTQMPAVARSFAETLSFAGIPHRFGGASTESDRYGSTSLSLCVRPEDEDRARAVVASVKAEPALDARQAAARASSALGSGEALASDVPDFDVPDLLPPADVAERAGTLSGIAFGWSIAAFAGFTLAIIYSPWWWLVCAVGVAESVRAKRRARSVLLDWERSNEEPAPRD